MNRTKGKMFYFLYIIVACIFLGSCTFKKPIKKDPFLEKWKLMAEKSKGYSPSPANQTVIIPKDENNKKEAIGSEEKTVNKQLPTQKITLKMQDADVATVLRALARTVDRNLLINKNIEGKIKLHLINTPWNDAFMGILKTHSLTYSWEGDILCILTNKEREENTKKEAEFLLREKEKRQIAPLLAPKIIPVNYADAKKIQENLSQLLTTLDDKKGTNGSVLVDEHTNSLIIQATKDDTEQILSLLKKLDKPTAQILIEANIVETSLDTARSLGIQWGGRYANSAGGNEFYANPGWKVVTGDGDDDRDIGVRFPASVIKSVDPAAIGLAFGSIGGNILDFHLSALEREGKLKILSRPSITTLDNQTAFTENGTKVPFVTTTIVDGTVTQVVEFIDVVLRLEITPHVIDKKNIKMKIMLKKDEVDNSREVFGNPFILKKQTGTTLIVEDGETIVISGLTKEVKSKTVNGIPWFKTIPFVGVLFKDDTKIKSSEEVMIFITPHILKEKVTQNTTSKIQTSNLKGQ